MIDEHTPEQRLEIKEKINELEQFYVDGSLKNLPERIEKIKNELVDKMEYFKNHQIERKYDKYGNEEKIINKYLVSTYFFRSLNEIGNISPNYNGENLSIVFGLYKELVEEVNLNICPFAPSLTHFCQFAGITVNTLKDYRSSKDKNLREVAEKIFDACYQAQMTASQTGITKETSTIYRMKTENDVVEKKTPNVNVNITESIDTKAINRKLDNILGFKSKTIIDGEYSEK